MINIQIKFLNKNLIHIYIIIIVNAIIAIYISRNVLLLVNVYFNTGGIL